VTNSAGNPPANVIGVVLPLERLSEFELAALKRLKDSSQIAGILLGAVRGSGGEWDLRPLIQTPSGTIIVRGVAIVSNDENISDAQVTLRETLRAFAASSSSPEGFAWGENAPAKILWMSRRWYDQSAEITLSDDEFYKLVADLVLLHGGGVGHGHLVKDNLRREGANNTKILDPGFSFFVNTALASGGQHAGDPRAADLRLLVELAPSGLQARVQSAVTTGRLASLTVQKNSSLQNSGQGYSGRGYSGQGTATLNNPAQNSQPEGRGQVYAPFQPVTQPKVLQTLKLRLVKRVAAALVAISIVAGVSVWYRQEREIIPMTEATQALFSGQPSLMAQVAVAAIAGQRSAQALIVQAVTEGKISDKLVNKRLITIAFDARWEQQLSDNDRETILRLSLAKLYPEGLNNSPSFSNVHPGILLAVIADISEERPATFADNISLAGFSSLPGEVGAAFKALTEAGVQQVSDPSARALARIIGSSATDNDIARVLEGRGAGARLRALVPLFELQPKLARNTLNFIASSSGVLTELLRFLGSDFSAGWGKAAPQTILNILAGTPPASLQVDQWADLLAFPEPGVKRAAAVALTERFVKQESETVTLLAAADLGLSRSQIATLVSALGLPPEERYTLLSRWFTSGPNVQALKSILLVRNKAAANDPFNLEAARALSNSNIVFSNAELRRLTQFKEPLVRAIAYSHLTSDDPAQREILEQSAQQESDQKLRNGLLERLSDYARTQAALSK